MRHHVDAHNAATHMAFDLHLQYADSMTSFPRLLSMPIAAISTSAATGLQKHQRRL